MTRYEGQATISEACEVVRGHLVEDIPAVSGATIIACPTCYKPIPATDQWYPDYDEMEKIRGWTIAQFIAFCQLQHRSGIPFGELLARTSGGVMPGIGGAINGDVGTIGVNDLNGIFVGIEPDGYTHS